MNTYISLFSSAGVGCYGFKLEGFECIATSELLERRIKIQQFNHKCARVEGYICGDITQPEIKQRIFDELNFWRKNRGVKDLDVLIATPPCQGMSVANHKKTDEVKELKRNSLVVESISMTKIIKPRFFVFENVRSFLTTGCVDTDGEFKSIKESINSNLAGDYNILFRIVNFKDYGCPSSRTRTLVIGSRKDIPEIAPFEVFPDRIKEITLRQAIGHLRPLSIMGEISCDDIYHSYRSFDPMMLPWIDTLPEGGSAFDNTDPDRKPFHLENGVRVYNVMKNGDKYTRQFWDKVAPCIHTRNDQLASQNTIHPRDNRVFSIREVMLLMSVPDSFQWTDKSLNELNSLSEDDKRLFLRKEEMNIRQNLGEAVPTIIFQQIARKVRFLNDSLIPEKTIKEIIVEKDLTNHGNLLKFIKMNKSLGFTNLSRIAELSNSLREDNEGFYTQEGICFSMVKNLPDPSNYDELSILEPSIGVGNFLPAIVFKYYHVNKVTIDVFDIDPNSISILKELVSLLDIPSNFTITYTCADTLLFYFGKRYDIVIGNPPYKKLTGNPSLLRQYRDQQENKDTNNLFAFFIEKTIRLGTIVSLVVPKSLINSPEFNATRDILSYYCISNIIDYGEKGFKGVKIETISFCVDTSRFPYTTTIESYITQKTEVKEQGYFTDKKYPYWLLYRNDFFDRVSDKMVLGIFKSYRDRTLTKKNTKNEGMIRVLKSRNIGIDSIIDIPGYDTYVDSIDQLAVGEFLNNENCVLVPNLTYYPRAVFLPKDCITDGSVAILTLKDSGTITKEDLLYYSSEEFRKYYKIARNLGTRSLNIDNNSVFFFGKLK